MDIISILLGAVILFLIAGVFAVKKVPEDERPQAHQDDGYSILQIECPQCGQKHDMDHHTCPFCEHCYNIVVGDCQPKKDRYRIMQTQCPTCGTTHDEDYHTCPYCGHEYRCKHTYRED